MHTQDLGINMYAKLNTFILISLFNQDSSQEFPIQYKSKTHTQNKTELEQI